MTLSFTIGWWLAPLLVTALSFGTLCWQMNKPENSRGFIPAGLFIGLIGAPVALGLSLGSWLIWALFR